MSSVSRVRLPGLASGMDTEAMVKQMLTGEQSKVDKAKQKEQVIKWQQEIYRDTIKDVKGFNDKYLSITSKDSIISSSAWNSLNVTSSNQTVMSASANAGATKVNYNFKVNSLAESAKATSSKAIAGKDVKLSDLGANPESFKIEVGKDKDGNAIYSKDITISSDDTVGSLIDKINASTDNKINASYSEMTGSFSIQTEETGKNASFKIVDSTGNESSALDFIVDTKSATGKNASVDVFLDGNNVKTLDEETNSFTIDNIKYDLYSKGESTITSKQDPKIVADKMKTFVEDYNKIMDKMYDLVTEKVNRDAPPLTEAQKKDMSEEEITRWEKKAKQGLLRNDSEMRRFMDDMQNAIFGDKNNVLSKMGLTTPEDYNKRGQISLDEKKFMQALEKNPDEVYEAFAKDSTSMMEKMNTTIDKYVGGSGSIFARKAGLDKTASSVKNFYSEQIKRQEEMIKQLQRKMDSKEDSLYKKFGQLEASMNKFNSQMNYFAQS